MIKWLQTLWGVVIYNNTIVYEVHNADFVLLALIVVLIIFWTALFGKRRFKGHS